VITEGGKIDSSKTEAAYLKAQNPKADAATLAKYQTYMEIKYSIDDGQTRVWLNKADFIAYLTTGSTTVGSTTHTLDRKAIVLGSIQAKWTSTDGTKFIPSNPDAVSVTFPNLEKWVNVQTILDSLKVMPITGDTWHLSAASLGTIMSALNALSDTTQEFSIKVSTQSTFPVGTSLTRTITSSDLSLAGLHMNNAQELFFKIVKKSTTKYTSSTAGAPTTFEPTVKWDNTHATTSFKRWIKVDKSALSAVVLTGQTNNIDVVVPHELVQSNDGILSATGAQTGVEVVYSISGSFTGVNSAKMPFNIFKEYLEGKITGSGSTFSLSNGVAIDSSYGFTDANFKIPHHGYWGASDIRVGYRALTGFIIDTSSQGGATTAPTVTGLGRYIDLKSLTDELKNIKTIISSGSAYVDTQNLKWALPSVLATIDTVLKADIWFIMTTSSTPPSLTDTGWTKDLHSITTTNDDQTKRHLYIKFTQKGPIGTEKVVLSEGTHTAANAYTPKITELKLTGVNATKINIAKTGIDLRKVLFGGNTKTMTIDETPALPATSTNGFAHGEIKYYLGTTFGIASQLPLGGALNKADFIIWASSHHAFPRTAIRAVYVPDTGYTMVPSELTTINAADTPTVTSLKSFYDVSVA
ncbi:MAG: hypothetical protein KAG91_00085, partial [Mycoplasmataceae bacterium]|nr:hypothetical protein [Mycoplasmataceae bacterium]